MKIRYKKLDYSEEEMNLSHKLMRESFEDKEIATNEYYEWQYLSNPIGRGTVLLAFSESNLVGQFALIPCEFELNDSTF